jgi:hypothetical protein
MIRYPTGAILTSHPPKIEMEWWCRCGYRQGAEPDSREFMADQRDELWRAANRQRKYEEEAARRAQEPIWRQIKRWLLAG